jgi:hypothetical protein
MLFNMLGPMHIPQLICDMYFAHLFNDNNFGIQFNNIMLEIFRKLKEQIGNFFGEFENELNSTYRSRAPS